MNRKYNPFVSLAALLLAAIILALTCTGCSEMKEKLPEKQEYRFTIEREGNGCTIITDTQTGVQYLYCAAGYGGGLCVLQPGEAQP